MESLFATFGFSKKPMFVGLRLRQNKTFEPAERASKALRAPHHAGLFAMGS